MSAITFPCFYAWLIMTSSFLVCNICFVLSVLLTVNFFYCEILLNDVSGWSHFSQFTIAVVNKDPKKSKYSGWFIREIHFLSDCFTQSPPK
jgi:hypothetical protein